MKVKEAVALIVAACDTHTLPQTCDQLIAGDREAEVTGIVCPCMATVDVIRDAIDKCANLIITHEPTFFTGQYQTDWLVGDKVYSLKQQLKRNNRINIWRFHDHMHLARPDKIYVGLNKEPGWEKYVLPDKPHCYVISPATAEALSAFLKEKLNVKAARFVGRRDSQVEPVGFLVGGGSLGLGSEQMSMELMRTESLDVMVCDEIL